MNERERLQLWNWINEYTIACGGDPSDTRYARQRREETVARVEQTVREILERLFKEGFPPIPVEVRQDKDDPTLVHMKTELPAHMVTDWMARGNIRHENKPDPRVPNPNSDQMVELRATSGTLYGVLAAVYRSDIPDDKVYEVVGKLLRAGITNPTIEQVDDAWRAFLNAERKDMKEKEVPLTAKEQVLQTHVDKLVQDGVLHLTCEQIQEVNQALEAAKALDAERKDP